MSANVVYMPSGAINVKECLDDRSILVRVIGETRKKARAPIAKFVKNIWKSRGAYRITRVNRQSFKIGFYNVIDYDRLKNMKWEHLDGDLLVARAWNNTESVTKDVLATVPQKVLIHNIPQVIWGEEAIGRIASSLGSPIEVKSAAASRHPHLPPPLEICVVIGRSFNYPRPI